jgi:hypothetical protein
MNKLNRLLFEVLSLSSGFRVYVFIFVLIMLTIIPVSFLESQPNISICSQILGKYCYSVGITRGSSALLKGDFDLAWDYNPLSFLVVLMIIFLIIYDVKNKFPKKFINA